MHVGMTSHKCAEIGVLEYSTPGGLNIEHLKSDPTILYWLNPYNTSKFKEKYLSMRLAIRNLA